MGRLTRACLGLFRAARKHAFDNRILFLTVLEKNSEDEIPTRLICRKAFSACDCLPAFSLLDALSHRKGDKGTCTCAHTHTLSHRAGDGEKARGERGEGRNGRGERRETETGDKDGTL